MGAMKKIATTTMMLLSCCTLVACSSTPKSVEEPIVKRTPVAKIALIAIQDPPRLSVENRGSPLALLGVAGALAIQQIGENRSGFLVSTFRNNALKLGDEMSVALADQLRGAGYAVDVLTDVKRPADDPDEIDYDSLPTLPTDADAILVARFDEVGLFSGFSTKFRPRLNLDIELYAKADQEDLYSQTFYYGADARERAEDQIPSDPKYAYSSFGEAVEQPAGLVEAFRIGIKEIAVLAAQQMRSRGI